MSHSRFAIYYLPPNGPLADFGATWLGWDVALGREVPQPEVPGLDEVTSTPRKYGFHGTLKPPFRLSPDQSAESLIVSLKGLAARTAAAVSGPLKVNRIGPFLALTPTGDTTGISRVAAAFVEGLDAFRASPEAAELSRRRAAGLTERQEDLLARWGYPFVMEEFHFHLTLTGRLLPGEIDAWTATVSARLPDLSQPFTLSHVALCGERADGRFECIHRYPLTG